MTAKIEFVVSNQTDFLNQPLIGEIHDIKLVNNKTTGKSLICLRYGNDLLGYEFNIETNSWTYSWRRNVFGDNTDITVNYPTTKYPWLIADVFGTGDDVIIIRNPSGVQFYQPMDGELKLITVHGFFEEKNTFLIGHFFPDSKYVTALGRNGKGEVKFYGTEGTQVRNDNQYPLSSITGDLGMNSNWSDLKTKLYLAKFDSQSLDSIILQTEDSLEIYQFDSEFNLKMLMKTTVVDRIGRIFFANITNNKYQDILNLNENGLFLYKFDDGLKDFKLLSHNDMFSSKYRGWNEEFTESIRFADLNNDGLSDLIFTGSQGLSVLSYSSSKNEWECSLSPKSLDPKQRFSTVLTSFSLNQKTMLFMQNADGICDWGVTNVLNVESKPPLVPPTDAEDKEIPWSPSSIRPTIDTNLQLSEKPDLRWTNQWDGGFIRDIVNVNTGQVEFTVPFMDLDFSAGLKFQLAFEYKTADTTDNLLGAGWSVPAIDYYITVDRSGSIFKGDFIYYLIRQNNRQQLQMKTFDDIKIEFTLDEQPELSITYDEGMERWTIKSETEEVIFGKTDDPNSSKALQLGLGWPNWNGSGNEIDKLKEIVFSWYISERRSIKTGDAMYFEYENDMASISNGKSYTNGIRLKSMSNGERGHINLLLEYEKKSDSEYKVVTPVDDDGNLSFPVQLTLGYVLKGYKLVTDSYRQNIIFNYEMNDGLRVLKEIQQNVLNSVEPILKFDYQRKDKELVLQKCHLPTGASVNVEYKSSTFVNPPVTHRNTVDDMVSIIKGPDYVVMAYRSVGFVETIYRVYDDNMNKVALSGTTYDYKKNIKGTMARAYTNTFVIVQETDDDKELYFFLKTDEKWSADPTIFKVNKDAYVRFGKLFVAAAKPDDKELTIFTLHDDSKTPTWEQTKVNVPGDRSMKNFIVQNDMIVGHDDKQLWTLNINSQKEWHSQILDADISSYVSMTKDTFDKFDFNDELKTQLTDNFKYSALQVYGNMVLVGGIQISDDKQLTISLSKYLLGPNYEVVNTLPTKIGREKLLDLSYEIESEDDKKRKITFKIQYLEIDNKYAARVVSFTGELMDEINQIGNRNRRQDELDKLLKSVNENKTFKELFKKAILFKLDKYQTLLSRDGVVCGSDILLKMTGTEWKQTQRENTQHVLLGPKFLLQFKSDDPLSIQLYKQDDAHKPTGLPLRELKLKRPGQVVSRFPAYIAYESPQNITEVITFKDYSTLGEDRSFPNETLILESDLGNLMTLSQDSQQKSKFEWIARSISNLVSSLPQLLVDYVSVIVDNVSRLTAYERVTKYDDLLGTYETKVITIAGGNRNISGWYEQSHLLDLHSSNSTVSLNVFYADGRKVENLPKEDQNNQKKKNETVDDDKFGYRLYDKSGEWTISNFMPFSMKRSEVAYIGFESYELLDAWDFNEYSIVRGGFAYTGDSYLHLDSQNSFVERSLQPEDSDRAYIASGWIRTNIPLKINAPTSALRAVVLTDDLEELITVQSRTTRQSGEWYYVEVIIDLPLIKSSHSDLKKPTIKLIASSVASRLESLDLDHIRFSPMQLDFEANVFSNTGRILATIDNKGLVMRKVYDQFGNEMATVLTDGVIENFYKVSQSGRLHPHPEGVITNPTSRFRLEPKTGFYELFDSTAWTERWKISDADVWNVSNGKLMHKHANRHSVQLNPNLLNKNSAAIRFTYHLENDTSLYLNWFNFSISLTSSKDKLTTLNLSSSSNKTISSLPHVAELDALVDQRRIILWVEGVVILDETVEMHENDKSAWKSFVMEMEGNVLLNNMIVMSDPSLTVEYYNSWGEKTQTIEYENENTVHVSEKLYDQLGRPSIEAKRTRINQKPSEALLAYYKSFVEGTNPNDENSVWKTGVLKGDVDRFNPECQGMPFSQVIYEKNPLNDKEITGYPGKEFSVYGPFSKQFSKLADIPFMKNLYPEGLGYRHEIEKAPNGSQTVSVFDSKKNKVAEYVKVQSFNHLLTTYEYDNENHLIKFLPPVYHEIVDSASKTEAWKPGDKHLTDTEKQYQKLFGSFFKYDKDGHLVERTTPDTGTVKFLYNSQGLMKFNVKISSSNEIDEILFYEYDSFKQVTRTGQLTEPMMSITELEKIVNNEGNNFEYSQDYQRFEYTDSNENPLIRGAKKNVITYNVNFTVSQEVLFNDQRKLTAIKTTLPKDLMDVDLLNSVEKEYSGDSIKSVTYPLTVDSEPLKIIYTYNKLKQLIGVGAKNEPSKYATFTYDKNGLLSNELIRSGSDQHLTRNYQYNSPGYLESISDPYFTEKLSYTNGGYGQAGFGDGIIMHTIYNATWSENADKRMFRIDMNRLDREVYPSVCIKNMQKLGYVDRIGRILKSFVPRAENLMPIECGGSTGIRLAQLFAEKQRPTFYGHTYAYGNHQELVNAKFFNEGMENFIEPLQPDVIAEQIAEVTESSELFENLAKSGFFLLDKRQGRRVDVAKEGAPIIRLESLTKDLTSIDEMYSAFVSPITKLLISLIVQEKSISLQEFIDIFLQWRGLDKNSAEISINKSKEIATVIYNLLTNNGYLTENALEPNFISSLGKYKKYLPKIVQVISQHFDHSLGEYPFDVESYEIDANGNHRLFYNGFNRYQLDYVNGTNKIESIKVNRFDDIDSEKVYKMEHDSSGNVIKAMHKNIERIEYVPTSQRVKSISMTDGRKLEFFYDSKGERILKRVIAPNGTISQDTYYVRDDKGSVLLDKQIKYYPEPLGKKVVTTAYMYGPNGLIGFIRNNQFHNVITDHAGSVRVIVKDGLVVAAYDYMPYGEIMRIYGSDPLSHIAYRYTGQEFDEETGLYNYHARLYDPSIGRFYQIDPQSQYSSPYKYAGNSPISIVDPDGEFGFLAVAAIAGLILGAYLGGAAANDRWNPIDWDFKDSSTWTGIGLGAFTGAFLPGGVEATVAILGYYTIALGTVGTYLFIAASQQSWNPLKWNYGRPALYYGAFNGFSVGAGMVGAIKGVHTMAADVTKTLNAERVFIGGSYLLSGGVMYGMMVYRTGEVAFWEWNYTSPETWATLIGAFKTGVSAPTGLIKLWRIVKEIPKYLKGPEFEFEVAYSVRTVGNYQKIESVVFHPRDLWDALGEITSGEVPTRLSRAAMFVSIVPMAEDLAKDMVFFHTVDKLELLSDLNQNETMTSSSTSNTKHNFWPLNVFGLLKSATKVVNNYVFSKPTRNENNRDEENSCSDSMYFNEKDCKKLLGSKPVISEGNNVYTDDVSGPSIVEMGDQWLAQTSIQGNIMLGMIFINKLFGRGESQRTTYKTKSTVELDIEANKIVENFIEIVMQQSLSCGIAGTVRKFIRSDNLENVVKSVRQKINSGNVDDIPQLLIKLVLTENMNVIAMKSSKKQADKLLKNIQQSMIEFKQFLVKQQDEWMFIENSTELSGDSQGFLSSDHICQAHNASMSLGRNVGKNSLLD